MTKPVDRSHQVSAGQQPEVAAKHEKAGKTQKGQTVKVVEPEHAIITGLKQKPLTLIDRIIHYIKNLTNSSVKWIDRKTAVNDVDNAIKLLKGVYRNSSPNDKTLIEKGIKDIRNILQQLKGIGASKDTMGMIKKIEDKVDHITERKVDISPKLPKSLDLLGAADAADFEQQPVQAEPEKVKVPDRRPTIEEVPEEEPRSTGIPIEIEDIQSKPEGAKRLTQREISAQHGAQGQKMVKGKEEMQARVAARKEQRTAENLEKFNALKRPESLKTPKTEGRSVDFDADQAKTPSDTDYNYRKKWEMHEGITTSDKQDKALKALAAQRKEKEASRIKEKEDAMSAAKAPKKFSKAPDRIVEPSKTEKPSAEMLRGQSEFEKKKAEKALEKNTTTIIEFAYKIIPGFESNLGKYKGAKSSDNSFLRTYLKDPNRIDAQRALDIIKKGIKQNKVEIPDNLKADFENLKKLIEQTEKDYAALFE